MVGEANLIERANLSVEEYDSLIRNAVQLQKEIEGFYLRQEAHIRKRVALIDEVQSCLTEERQCLEVQHQECRAQISTARRNMMALSTEQSTMSKAIQAVTASLVAEEATLDGKLEEVGRGIAQEDELLNQLLDKRDALAREERAMEAKERHQQQEDEDLKHALREIEGLAQEVEQRRVSLLKKDDTIADWNRSLETRERELVLCQDQLRDDLRQLETDEARHGIAPQSSSGAVISTISQREVMDDNDMSIELENDCEEIDLEMEDQ